MTEIQAAFSRLLMDFTFQLVGRDVFDHLHWGLWQGVKQDPRWLPIAQERYAERIVALVGDVPSNVLDVGCGLGGLARQLAQHGHQVVAVTPLAAHAELLVRAAVPGLQVLSGRFEELAPIERFGVVLFAESWNFFMSDRELSEAQRTQRTLARAALHLAPGGKLIVAEILDAEIHAALCAAPGFVVESDADVTEEAAYTAEALQWHVDRYVLPTVQLVVQSVAVENELLARQLQDAISTLPHQGLRELLLGKMAENGMLTAGGRYRFMVLRSRS